MLEDNVRTPSGVSYVVENRVVTKRIFQGAIDESARAPGGAVPHCSWPRPCARSSPSRAGDSAHVGGADPRPLQLGLLRAHLPGAHHGPGAGRAAAICSSSGDTVFVRTTHGPQRVHVIYRRIDDAYLDPGVLPPGQPAGGARPDAGLRRRPGGAGQRPGQRLRRRQGGLPLRARHDPLLPGGGGHPGPGRYLRLRPPGGPAVRDGEPAASWWSRRWTRRGATAC